MCLQQQFAHMHAGCGGLAAAAGPAVCQRAPGAAQVAASAQVRLGSRAAGHSRQPGAATQPRLGQDRLLVRPKCLSLSQQWAAQIYLVFFVISSV